MGRDRVVCSIPHPARIAPLARILPRPGATCLATPDPLGDAGVGASGIRKAEAVCRLDREGAEQVHRGERRPPEIILVVMTEAGAKNFDDSVFGPLLDVSCVFPRFEVRAIDRLR